MTQDITPKTEYIPSPQEAADLAAAAHDYDVAKSLYHDSAKRGCIESRLKLNALCLSLSEYKGEARQGKLHDYSGREISFLRGGIPVCGRLVYENGRAVMDMSLNMVERSISDMKLRKPSRAVVQGIKQWQGRYTVFGGYPLDLRIKTTYDLTTHNSLIINIIDDSTADSVTDMLKKLGSKGRRSADIISSRRQTAASFGRRWHLSGVKYINLYEDDLKSVPRCKFLARHEFGHILGLDDMYAEAADGRKGVPPVYPHLAPFYISGSTYNMIMCSVDAPVTYKDIEMVLLAYRDDKPQQFQLKYGKGEISAALVQD